jgi:hypothetical protein
MLEPTDPSWPRPDARIRFGETAVAVEIELTAKTASKYDAVFSAHDRAIRAGFYQKVAYLTPHPTLARFLQVNFDRRDDPSRFEVYTVALGLGSTDGPDPAIWTKIMAPRVAPRASVPPSVPVRVPAPVQPIQPTFLPRSVRVTLLDGTTLVFFIGPAPLRPGESRYLLATPGVQNGPTPPQWKQYFRPEEQEYWVYVPALEHFFASHGGPHPDSWTLSELLNLQPEPE